MRDPLRGWCYQRSEGLTYYSGSQILNGPASFRGASSAMAPRHPLQHRRSGPGPSRRALGELVSAILLSTVMSNIILPGTEVEARRVRWEVVSTQELGAQTLFRLRGLENAVLGKELDLLSPFEEIRPVRHDIRPERAAPLANWLVYHQAFLLSKHSARTPYSRFNRGG